MVRISSIIYLKSWKYTLWNNRNLILILNKCFWNVSPSYWEHLSPHLISLFLSFLVFWSYFIFSYYNLVNQLVVFVIVPKRIETFKVSRKFSGQYANTLDLLFASREPLLLVGWVLIILLEKLLLFERIKDNLWNASCFILKIYPWQFNSIRSSSCCCRQVLSSPTP